jgi:hypothetical protein
MRQCFLIWTAPDPVRGGALLDIAFKMSFRATPAKAGVDPESRSKCGVEV